eukprot:TRINITY_DN532_c0_g1_i5.p1 TRINITY_DN532_c0_g1~~TRINITY_DN532_c0_g1_i5.p1  ORF type:complete len:199 (-),score=69.52 TRINITY_DN532_c0_g1_i5:86-682(-)
MCIRDRVSTQSTGALFLFSLLSLLTFNLGNIHHTTTTTTVTNDHQQRNSLTEKKRKGLHKKKERKMFITGPEMILALVGLQGFVLFLLIGPIPLTVRRRIHPLLDLARPAFIILFLFLCFHLYSSEEYMKAKQEEWHDAKNDPSFSRETMSKGIKFRAERNFYLSALCLSFNLLVIFTHPMVSNLIRLEERDIARGRS